VSDEQQTFLFADLAGFTALTEAHGDEFAADAATEFYAGVHRLLPEYRGEVVKRIGDAVMVRVAQPTAAVRLAVRIIDEVGRRHGALGIRIGVHTGGAVNRDGDWFGAAVNLASRVAGAAEPGEVLMTAATRTAIADGLPEYEIRARGSHTFKNVAEPTSVFALTLAAQPSALGLPVDPVCRMAIDPAATAVRRVYRDVEYHFCSRECATVFDQHPARYASPA
jgi:class 3 adenylate cyclase/YHS domain-containing protein